jgi:hypothetical protein
MGLDTTHECWHGAYSAFMRWRRRLAEVAGYGDYETWCREQPHFPATKKDAERDALTVLLNHSDCDGEIATEYCGPLADRLEQLLPLLDGQEDWGHIGNYREKTQQFIDGLRRAAAAGEVVEFH